MFGYVSIAQLSSDIRENFHVIPKDVDLVVGIPRSGMIPAYLIGLFMNRLVTDLETFLADGSAGHGRTRAPDAIVTTPLAAKHILLVDDSIATGGSMGIALHRIRERFEGRVTTCAAIVNPSREATVDVAFRVVPQPRIFEWNAFHHPCVADSCFDLDGVLCVDPTERDNDDGPRYREFLSSARPLFKPTQRIGHIVSARLEKYRDVTEAWLQANGIAFGELHLVDLPSKEERMRLGIHCVHKAEVYKRTHSALFYESDPGQARQIAHLSGRPVLCVSDMTLHLPDGLRMDTAARTAVWHLSRPAGKIKGWIKHRLREARAQ